MTKWINNAAERGLNLKSKELGSRLFHHKLATQEQIVIAIIDWILTKEL